MFCALQARFRLTGTTIDPFGVWGKRLGLVFCPPWNHHNRSSPELV
nr:MAG TPA: hypothetical protein [Caudoviricetes sp.]